MARPSPGTGAKARGGFPLNARAGSSVRVPCPICDMPAGKRCVVYAISGGVRVYVRGPRRSSHPERVAAVRNLDTSTGDPT